MPGISLKYEFRKNSKNLSGKGQDLFLEAAESLLHNDYYKREFLLKEPCLVICTRYPGYPIRIFDNARFWACVEGKIYNKSDSELEIEVLELIDQIFSSGLSVEKYKQRVTDWLLETDGDFVLYALNKTTNDFFLINDLLGRLPLYYHVKDDSELIVSREIQLHSHLNHTVHEVGNKFDMIGIAQFLLFSHTIGRRTLLRNVSKLDAASILTLCNNKSKFEAHNLYVFNFENKKYANEDIKKNAQELVMLFLEGCKNRADLNSKNIVALSGGLDSRAVAAGLYGNKIPFSAVTSPEPNWAPVVGNLSESKIAEILANEFNVEWEDYDIMLPRAENLLTLLRAKNGLIYLAHSFLPRFLEVLRGKYGSSPVNFFTGHGGDVSFANLLFDVPDVDSCVRGIIHVKGRFPLNVVADVTKISKSELKQEIRNVLDSYPESSPSLKLVHFLFFENNAKFSFEIEDVNRLYFWSVAPFYSVPFFKYIFNCSDKSKEKLALYREFLNSLSPAAAKIENSNWGCSINSNKFKILQHILFLSFKYPKLRRWIKRVYDKRAYSYKADSTIIQCMRTQLKDCKKIANHLSESKAVQILNDCTQFSHEAMDNLLTVISLLEVSICGRSTIDKYY
jgi:asparagine synthase (glutamine-hydrolysing)